MKLQILFLAILMTSALTEKSYKDYKVFKIIPENENEVQLLLDSQKTKGLDFWTEVINVKQEFKIMVSPEQQRAFIDYLKKSNIKSEVVIEDVQKVIDDQLKPAPGARNVVVPFGWNRYHNLDEIYAWLDRLGTEYPNIVTVITMGTSNEGRDIKGVKIDFKPEGREKTLIGMYEGGIHAREWISPATVTWIINEFLTSTNSDIRFLAEHFVWHIFPVLNPDGYSYTFSQDRMWRKNRNTLYNQTCGTTDDDLSNGIDLNRNFGYLWMLTGASNNSCSNTYAGPSANSEPETRAVIQYVNGLKQQGELIYYIAFHSFTQLILVPYSHIDNNHPGQSVNFTDLFHIATRGAAQIQERYGTFYRVGASPNVMYPMSGTSFDWAKGEAEVPLSYLFELRDLGTWGFLLNPEQIVPTGQETIDGLLEMDRAARDLGHYSSAKPVIGSVAIIVFGLLINLL